MAKHRIVMARSGVQYYTVSELPSLGLTDIPQMYADLAVFGVYRPAEVVRRALPKLKGTPVVPSHNYFVQTGHEPFIIGTCGKHPTLRIIDGEAMVMSDMDIPDESRAPKYSELSLGYTGSNRWCEGKTRDGEPYQIVCNNISNVEHLAYVPRARGGKHVRILDAASEKLNSLLYRVVHRVTDGATSWDVLIKELRDVDRYSQEDVERFAQGLVQQVQDCADSPDKELLLRYLADLPVLWDDDPNSWNTALDVVEKLYNSIQGASMQPTTDKPADDKPQTTETPQQPAQPSPMASIDSTLKIALAQTLTAAVSKACADLLGVDVTMAAPQQPAQQPPVDGNVPPKDGEQPPKDGDKSEDNNQPPKDGDKPTDDKPPVENDKPDAQGSDGATQAQPNETTKDGGDSIVVTKEEVVAENNAASSTEVPPAAVATAVEEVMTPEGVVPADTGQLRNQAEGTIDVGDNDTSPIKEPEPAEPPVATETPVAEPAAEPAPVDTVPVAENVSDGNGVVININTPVKDEAPNVCPKCGKEPCECAKVLDGMPVFNAGISLASQNGNNMDALTSMFNKMKGRM